MSFEDQRDAAASPAKMMIQNVRKKIADVEKSLGDPRKLARPDGIYRKLDEARKFLDRILDKDPDWDTSVEEAYLGDLETLVGQAAGAASDDAYQDGFEKLVGAIEEALGQEKRLDRPAWFDNQYKGFERFFDKVAKSEPDRNVSPERDRLEALKDEVDRAVAGRAQDQVADSEPDPEEFRAPVMDGVDIAAAIPPAWGQGIDIPGNVSLNIRDYGRWADDLCERHLGYMAQHPCRQPDLPRRQEWAALWRQAVIHATGLRDAEVCGLFQLFVKIGSPEYAELKAETVEAFAPSQGRGALPGARPPRPDQVAFDKAIARAVGCEGLTLTMGSGDGSISGLEWWMDRGTYPGSELARAVFILSQIGAHVTEGRRRGGATYADEARGKFGGLAFVGPDARRLDEEKFRAELDELGLNEYGRANALMTFSRARHMAAVFEAVFAGSSPAAQELIREAPEAGFQAWQQEHAAAEAAWDYHLDVEEAYLEGLPQGFQGTYGPVFGHFQEYLRGAIQRAGASTLQEIEDVAFGPVGYGLASALVVAAAREEHFVFACWLYQKMDDRRVWRGPRWAAYMATLDRWAELHAVDPNFGVAQSDVSRWLSEPSPGWLRESYSLTFNKSGSQDGGGVVESVEPQGQQVRVQFVHTEYERTIYDVEVTNKIDRIDKDGQFHYKKIFTPIGKETVNSTEPPMTIATELAGGIVPGSLVEAKVVFSEAREAVPLQVWDGPDKGRLIAWFGVEL